MSFQIARNITFFKQKFRTPYFFTKTGKKAADFHDLISGNFCFSIVNERGAILLKFKKNGINIVKKEHRGSFVFT